MFKEGKGEIVFEKEKRKRKIESFWPGRKKNNFAKRDGNFYRCTLSGSRILLGIICTSVHGAAIRSQKTNDPSNCQGNIGIKKEKEEGPRFFCAFTKVSLSRLATLTLPGFYDSFHVWLGKKRIPGKCARPLNALCRPCRHAAFVLTRYYVRPLYPSSSSLSCSPRCIFFVLVTRKLIIFESTSRNLIVTLLGMVSRRDFYPKNDK